MPSFPKKSGLLWRIVLRPLVFAVPFAIFFQVLSGSPPANFPSYYLASLIFAVTILLFVEANRRWVAPRLTAKGKPKTGGPLVLEIASYALSSILGSLTAALILNSTLAPGFLGSVVDIVRVLLFAIVFSALFLGVIYAMNIQRRYIGQVRREAETMVREEQEMRVAAEIQQALLPPRSRVSSTYAAVAATIPCRTIGGDFFDYFDLPGGGLGFILADVAGKGPSAAIMAANVQGIFASHVTSNDGPAAVLKRVNQALYRRTVETRFAQTYTAVEHHFQEVAATLFRNVRRDGMAVSSTQSRCRDAARAPGTRVAAGEWPRRLRSRRPLRGPRPATVQASARCSPGCTPTSTCGPARCPQPAWCDPPGPSGSPASVPAAQGRRAFRGPSRSCPRGIPLVP
jgi:hypothetical protein